MRTVPTNNFWRKNKRNRNKCKFKRHIGWSGK